MKILMTTDAVGGIWTYSLEMIRQLAKHDVQVVLAVIGPPPSTTQVAEVMRFEHVQLRIAGFKLEWMHEPWDDVARAGEWLQALAQRENVQLVHLNGYSHAALAWSVPVITVAHSCVFTWWQAVHGCNPPAEWQTYFTKVAAGMQSTQVLVAPTRSFLCNLLQCYQPAVRTRVIHNGRTAATYRRLKYREREPVVFACGRLWDAAKGMRTLDAAAAHLDWPVYVAGEARSPQGQYFSATSLRTLGTLPAAEVAAWLQQVAIFVHPARYEPFGLAVLEAALAGCALVLADIPSLRELWDGAALFVDMRDAGELRAALASLTTNTVRRRCLSRAARTRAARYSAERMGNEYHALYQDLLSTAGEERAG